MAQRSSSQKGPRGRAQQQSPSGAIRATSREAAPAAAVEFDCESVAASFAFGPFHSACSAAIAIASAADLSRGVAMAQPDCPVLAPIAHEAVTRMWCAPRLSYARRQALRGFCTARSCDYESDGAGGVLPDSPWHGRFDARELRANAPWTSPVLYGAARDFLLVEAKELAEDPLVTPEGRAAGLIAIGALAAIQMDGTSGVLLEWAALAGATVVDVAPAEMRAWLMMIATQSFESLHALARDGHLLLGRTLGARARPVRESLRGRKPDPDGQVQRFIELIWLEGPKTQKELRHGGCQNPADLYARARARLDIGSHVTRGKNSRGLTEYRWV